MNLLTKEESKVSQKMVIINKYKENMERIRVNVLKNKEMVDEMKRFKELELENKKMKINDLRNKIKVTLSSSKDDLHDKKSKITSETKNEQKKCQEMIQNNKQFLSEQKKSLHDQVQMQQKLKEEKKKKEEQERKLKLKKELEEKIEKELKIKKLYDEKINNYQEESFKIVQRINTLGIDAASHTMSKKNSVLNTSSSSKKK